MMLLAVVLLWVVLIIVLLLSLRTRKKKEIEVDSNFRDEEFWEYYDRVLSKKLTEEKK